MIHILITDIAGDFAENKDAARTLREKTLRPALAAEEKIVLDFAGVGFATQSFIHALLSDLIRSIGPDILDFITFRGCNENVAGLISIVVEYTQDSLEPTEPE